MNRYMNQTVWLSTKSEYRCIQLQHDINSASFVISFIYKHIHTHTHSIIGITHSPPTPTPNTNKSMDMPRNNVTVWSIDTTVKSVNPIAPTDMHVAVKILPHRRPNRLAE
jgi:hypothetical protein